VVSNICNLSNVAVIKGHLNCFKCLYLNRFPLNAKTIIYAAEYGRLEILEFIFEHNNVSKILSDNLIYSKTIEKGHLNVLKFLYDKKIEICGNLCSYTAFCGQLECLKFLNSKGYCVNEFTFVNSTGNLECLKYCFESLQNIRQYYQEEALIASIRKKNLECFKFLIENLFISNDNWKENLYSEILKTNNPEYLMIIINIAEKYSKNEKILICEDLLIKMYYEV